MKVDHAMIMAAGLGTRMRPLTNDKPKPLVQVAGKALLDHCLDHLRDASVRHIVTNVHYRPEMIESHMRGVQGFESIQISDERDILLETGGGLVKAQPYLGSQPFLCMNSDNIWTNGDDNAILKLADRWDDKRMDALLLLVPKPQAYCHNGVGDFYLDENDAIIRRGDRESAPYVYTGIQIVSHRLLRDPPIGAFSTNIFWDRAIGEGRLFGAVHDAKWFDIGSPTAIPIAEEELEKEILVYE